ncbi:hypothetical protein AM593_05915, partial [Mytilus galloprovincialis]
MPNKHVKEYPSMQRDALSYNVTIMILETSTFDLHLTARNNIQYDREEKDLMTEIRRNGALAEKGNV